MATKVKPSRIQITGTPQAGDVPVYVDQDTFAWGTGGGDVKVYTLQGNTDYATAKEARTNYLQGTPVIVMYGADAYTHSSSDILYSYVPSVFSASTISTKMLIYTTSGSDVTGIDFQIMTFTKPGVIDNLTSSSTSDALSANQGKELKTMIDNLTSRGRFLSLWDSATGLAMSNPQSFPYTYQTGDYFIVGNTGSTNYKPDGSSYTGTASTVVETGEVEIGDTYAYDGTNWLLQNNHGKTVTFSEIAGDPYDNTNLASALDDKQDVSNMVTTLSGADNNHYPTTKAVADAISSAGGGDVLGPSSSTNGDVVLFDGTTGKLIKDSGVQLSSKADDADVVKLTGNQTIAGTKTFSTSPVVPSKTTNASNSGTAIATEAQVYKKQDTISDLATIRSGASAGATALQSGDDVSELNNDAGYLTSSTGVTSVNGQTGVATVSEFSPSGTATTGYVVTKTATGYGWAAPAGGGIENVTTGTTSTITGIWAGTETQYNALGTKSGTVLYFTF